MRMLMALTAQRRAAGHTSMMLWICLMSRVKCWLISIILQRRKTFTLLHSWPGLSNLTRYPHLLLLHQTLKTQIPELAFSQTFVFSFLRLGEFGFFTTIWLSLWNDIRPAMASAASSLTAWGWARRCRSFLSLTSYWGILRLTLCWLLFLWVIQVYRVENK